MNYGISNKEGEIKTNEVFNILNFLKQKKINYIDTAFSYKKSEYKIGKFYSKSKKNSKSLQKFQVKIKKTWLINLIEQFLCLGILHIVYCS